MICTVNVWYRLIEMAGVLSTRTEPFGRVWSCLHQWVQIYDPCSLDLVLYVHHHINLPTPTRSLYKNTYVVATFITMYQKPSKKIP